MNSSVRNQEKNWKSNDFLTDVIIGLSDGLTIPFALAAGLSAVVSSNSTILIAGFTAVGAGSLVMALGGYQAAKTRLAHTGTLTGADKIEATLAEEKEKEDVKHFFANLGLNEDIQAHATEELEKDKQQWVELISKYELGLNKPDPLRARKSAWNIGCSYAVGGLVPLVPYLLSSTPALGLKFSVILTLACLLLFGFFKSRITGVNPWIGALRITILGALAATAAYGAASLFHY